MMEDGEYLYMLSIPESYDLKKLQIESININDSGKSLGATFSVLNNETGKYEQIKNRFTADKQEVSNYLKENKTIQLKIEKSSNNDPYVILPSLTLKGEIQK
jgi:hypothetical protein